MFLHFDCAYESDGVDTKSRGGGWRLRLGGDCVGSIMCFSTLIASMRGMELIQKAVVEDGGFALVWLSVPTVGKRVFLRIVSAIPTVMRGMTPSSTTVKKAAYGRSKSPAFAGTKTAANRSSSHALLKPLPMPSPRGGSSLEAPPQTLPKGRELIGGPSPNPPQGAGAPSCCVLGGCVVLLPLGEGWNGASDWAGGCGWAGASMVDVPHPWQLCRSYDFIAQG